LTSGKHERFHARNTWGKENTPNPAISASALPHGHSISSSSHSCPRKNNYDKTFPGARSCKKRSLSQFAEFPRDVLDEEMEKEEQRSVIKYFWMKL
jgi:hypothetical protein